MITKLKIKSVKDGTFKGEEGDPVEYYWVKGEKADGETIEFGTKIADYEIDTEREVDLDKISYVKKSGETAFRYREARS